MKKNFIGYFRGVKMGTRSYNISVRLVASAIIMLLALAWLTISLPFVNESMMLAKENIQGSAQTIDTEDTNPFANTTEEKTESGANSLSEYLHDPFLIEHHFEVLTYYYKCHPSDIYFAFHPDLNIPPPKAQA